MDTMRVSMGTNLQVIHIESNNDILILRIDFQVNLLQIPILILCAKANVIATTLGRGRGRGRQRSIGNAFDGSAGRIFCFSFKSINKVLVHCPFIKLQIYIALVVKLMLAAASLCCTAHCGLGSHAMIASKVESFF